METSQTGQSNRKKETHTVTDTITPATIAPVVAKAKAPKSKVALKVKYVRAAIAFSNAKRAIKAAEDRKNRAEAILREGLGDAEIGIDARTNMPFVEVMHSSNSKNDAKLLQARFPDAYAATLSVTPYTYLKTV